MHTHESLFCGYFTWNTVWSMLIRSFYLFFASFNFKRKGQKPIQKLNEWKKYIYSAPTWTKSTLTVRFSRLFHVRYFFYSRFLAAVALSLSSARSLSLSLYTLKFISHPFALHIQSFFFSIFLYIRYISSISLCIVSIYTFHIFSYWIVSTSSFFQWFHSSIFRFSFDFNIF